MNGCVDAAVDTCSNDRVQGVIKQGRDSKSPCGSLRTVTAKSVTRPELVQIKAAPAPVPAGEFSKWLRVTEASLESGGRASEVPCGACNACCRSSMFIHVKPEETGARRRIPRALLFAAPGLPKGHQLMGYNDKGECPMLLDGACSIYEDRPQTCREYDCRVFAATGIELSEQTQKDIAQRARSWVFTFENERSQREHATLKEAAAFLQCNEDLFPKGSLPTQPGPLAALAVKIYQDFARLTATGQGGDDTPSNARIAQTIMTALSERTSFPRRS